jgi:TusA-related sulfurtransferase
MESFDLRDTIVPISLLRISNHFRDKNPGETLEIICSEPDLVEDLSYLLPEPAYEFVSLVKINAADPEFRIVLKKAKD